MLDVVTHLRLDPPRSAAGKAPRRVPAYSRAAQMRDVMAALLLNSPFIVGRSASCPKRQRHDAFR